MPCPQRNGGHHVPPLIRLWTASLWKGVRPPSIRHDPIRPHARYTLCYPWLLVPALGAGREPCRPRRGIGHAVATLTYPPTPSGARRSPRHAHGRTTRPPDKTCHDSPCTGISPTTTKGAPRVTTALRGSLVRLVTRTIGWVRDKSCPAPYEKDLAIRQPSDLFCKWGDRLSDLCHLVVSERKIKPKTVKGGGCVHHRT